MMSSSTSRMLSLFRFGCSNDIFSSNLCSCCCCTVRSAYATYVFAPFSSCLRMPAYIPLPHAQEAPLAQVCPAWFGILAFTRGVTLLNSLYPSRRGGLSCAHSETVSYVAAARAAFSCSAHSKAISYSCNAALAVGIPFLVGCNPKLVCPATLMLFSVGTVPASGGTPTL